MKMLGERAIRNMAAYDEVILIRCLLERADSVNDFTSRSYLRKLQYCFGGSG